MAMNETLEQRRLTLVNALLAGKGWMTGYAEAFVDQYVEDARLTPPAQAVDVGANTWRIDFGDGSRIAVFDEPAPSMYAAVGATITPLYTRALAGEHAGWRDIATAPKGSRQVIALISNAGPNGYVTDPWTGWLEKDGTAARWPHNFPPTHWMPLPKLPTPPTDGEG